MERPQLLIVTAILLIGLFFRTYQTIERFDFAHDGDLYSWIVKDITINHHFRLIGQLTSAPGIFIGPLFYYLLVPFFLLTKMDPIGALIPITFIGLLTIFSYYFVFSRLFNKGVGLLGAFLYAVLISTVSSDRWVVPTVTTSFWSIWYFYTLINLSRGKFFILPILGILIGLIWHVHIALIPTLIAIPVALFISKSFPKPKQILIFLATLLITNLPLIIFELRHNFGQTYSLLNNLSAPRVGLSGFEKFIQVLQIITKNTNTLFFAPQSFGKTFNIIFLLILISSPFFLIKKKLISLKEIIPIYCWLAGVVLFFSLSSSPISEYYFKNIEVIFLAVASLFISLLLKFSRLGKILVFSILSLLLIKNAYFFVNDNYYHKGYVERKQVVDYITTDARARNLPCFGISYITSPGENVGFRYFFFLKKAHLVHPSLEIPVYNIVIPDELSLKEVKQKFGHIGLIPLNNIPPKNVIEKSCQTPDTNLSDPLFGYVE